MPNYQLSHFAGVDTYVMFFGPSEYALLSAQMALMVHEGWEFALLDDRGGSNCWIMKVVTNVSKPALPHVKGVEWVANDSLAVKY